jgi:hypothetical protein
MNRLEKHITRWLLKGLSSKICPDRVALDGRANCFVICINKAGKPYLAVKEIHGDQLSCLEWRENGYQIPSQVNLGAIDPNEIQALHHYKFRRIELTGLWDLTFHRVFKWVYITGWFSDIFNNRAQKRFNQTKLVRKQTIDILGLLTEQRFAGRENFEITELMTALHSIRWVRHPDADREMKALKFILESLIDGGEVKRGVSNYAVNGSALRTLERYHTEEQRHKDVVSTQYWMTFLTFLLVLTGILQACFAFANRG